MQVESVVTEWTQGSGELLCRWHRMGYDIYREMKNLDSEHICEIHIKENGNLLGQGVIDFPRVKTLLAEIDYKGWLIIEGATPKGMERTESCEKNAVYANKLFCDG